MDVESGEFQDWEVLHNSDDSVMVNSSDSVEIRGCLEGIEGDSEGIIRLDYFSLYSQNNYQRIVDVPEEGSVDSDNPSWIDPGSETRYPKKESGEFWSDSSSDRSDDRKFGEFEAKNELGIVENPKTLVLFNGIGEIVAGGENSCGMEPIPMKVGDFVEKSEMGAGDDANSQGGLEFSGKEKGVDGSMEGEGKSENVETEPMKSGGEEEKGTVVWWKLPLEFLKYCAFRVSPVWTVSVAAAVVGFVMLGRRLYKMKRKSRSLQLNVTVDDKKVSQFMSRAARLNEAFSVVKRVPIIRPALPAAGVTPWPVMSLR